MTNRGKGCPGPTFWVTRLDFEKNPVFVDIKTDIGLEFFSSFCSPILSLQEFHSLNENR